MSRRKHFKKFEQCLIQKLLITSVEPRCIMLPMHVGTQPELFTCI